MSTFSYTLDFGAQTEKKPTVNNIKFGEGYEQRASFGINTIKEVWNVSFQNRTVTEINEIDAFLETHGGVDSFSWTPPGQSTPKKFKCQEWNKQIVKGTFWNLSAKFEQVFEG